MEKLLRRIRGALGMGLIWGAAWGIAGSLPRWLFGIETDVPFPLVFGVLGFISGVTFSAVIALTEGRRSFDQLSIPRFASWGAVGGFLVSALFARAASLGLGDVLVVAPTFAVACAACASASLAIARRAERLELPNGRKDSAEDKLSGYKKRNLLGGGD
jgi:hypothetical protein